MTQDQALSILKTGTNAFLTGEPGSGKTYTVNQYIHYLRTHNISVAVTASTGIAATHLGGMTIHSWSGIGIKKQLTPHELKELQQDSRLSTRARKTSVLIIDEISMLDASTITAIDQALQTLRDDTRPFGGLQVIFVGDFFQLPPINKDAYQKTQFAFESPSWETADPMICYLSEQHRQSDSTLMQLLAAIRTNQITYDHQELLMERKITPPLPAISTRLYTHNADVDRINQQKLHHLPDQEFEFTMTSRGAKPLIEQLKKSCLSPENLQLKIGARVMCTKNNFEKGFVNGTLGEIIECTSHGPSILTTDGRVILITPMDWEINDGSKTLAAITQFPLRLAWAITVHKSQGMTLDEAIMDLSHTFEYGQGYVALSRVKSISGLHLLGINHQALQVHPQILEKDEFFKTRSQISTQTLSKLTNKQLHNKHEQFIRESGSTTTPTKNDQKKTDTTSTYTQTLDLFNQGKNIEEIAQERALTPNTIISHLEKLKDQNQIHSKLLHRLIPQDLKHHLPLIHQAFSEIGKEKLTPVFEKLQSRYTYEELHLARLVFK